jgi:alkane 1-monooxygenase
MGGIYTFCVVIYGFVFIPLMDVLLPMDTYNFTKEEESTHKKKNIYTFFLYGLIPLQYIFLYMYLNAVLNPSVTLLEIVGMTLSMGVISGNIVNLAHELGHRKNRFKQIMAKLSLMQILMMDFFIYHNHIHHKWVGTDKDPGSAKRGENFYLFFFQDVCGNTISAWEAEVKRLAGKKYPPITWANQILQYSICQGAFLYIITLLFGFEGLGYTLICSFFGHFVLSQLNYIQHYGLRRKKHKNGKYEKVTYRHAWNNPSFWSSVMLFQLSRHSDHHYKASIPYQVLKEHEDSPHHPFGYPVMMLLALFPPLWFYIMNPLVKEYR